MPNEGYWFENEIETNTIPNHSQHAYYIEDATYYSTLKYNDPTLDEPKTFNIGAFVSVVADETAKTKISKQTRRQLANSSRKSYTNANSFYIDYWIGQIISLYWTSDNVKFVKIAWYDFIDFPFVVKPSRGGLNDDVFVECIFKEILIDDSLKPSRIVNLENFGAIAMCPDYLYCKKPVVSLPKSSKQNNTLTNYYPSQEQITVIGRSQELNKIEEYIQSSIDTNGSTSIYYICGLPGTGKTFTTRIAIKNILSKISMHVNVLYFNAHRTDTTDLKSQITRSLSEYPELMQIVVIDEVDMLVKHRQQTSLYEIVNALRLPIKKTQSFIPKVCTICIANTLDLLDQLQAKIKSRIQFTSCHFKPYNSEQIFKILKNSCLENSAIGDDAIELISRRVSSSSGDVRRAISELLALDLLNKGNDENIPPMTNIPPDTNTCKRKRGDEPITTSKNNKSISVFEAHRAMNLTSIDIMKDQLSQMELNMIQSIKTLSLEWVEKKRIFAQFKRDYKLFEFPRWRFILIIDNLIRIGAVQSSFINSKLHLQSVL